nr:hypothetical protein [Shewanella sp.]
FYHTEKDWILFAQEIDEKAIRASKGEQSMPCMAETVGIITTQLDKYLAADWLDDSEKEAICFYKQQVLSLKNNGYPYKESLVLALEFTLIQDLYNFLSIDHVPENEAEEIKASSIADLDFDWGKHTELYNKAPGRFYSEVDFGPLTLENLIHQDWNTAFFGISSEQQEKFNNVTTSAIERETDDVKKVQMKQILAEKKKNEFKQRKTILTMQMMLPAIIGTDFEGVMEVLPTASDKKLFVPVFCDMTIKTMNLAQNTALVPIGLTTERVALHDQLKMSSAVLAFHDVFHESKIKSGVVDENIKRKKSHNMIVSFYKNQRQVNEYIHFIAENMLFGLGHEEGEELSDYVKNADILKEKLSMIKMFMEILPSSLLPPSFSLNDGEYSNKELEGLRWLQAHIESVFAPSSSDSSALAIFCRLQREAQVSV